MGRFVSKVPNHDPDRLKRILDDKQRTIGVDVEALNNQITAKRQEQAHEQSIEKSFAKAEDVTSLRVRQLQLEAERQRRDVGLDCATFWSTQQGKQTTREWDLNRKDSLLRSQPARLGDEDLRCGPCSFQKFAGEDLKAGDRKKAQQEENKVNWQAQQLERAKAAEAEKLEASNCAQLVQQQNGVLDAVTTEQGRLRQQTNKNALQENCRLAGEKQQREETAKQKTEQQNVQELNNMQASPFLNETLPACARKECWKGMSKEQVEQIYNEVGVQCKSKQDQQTMIHTQRNNDSLQDFKTNQKAFSIARQAEELRRQRSRETAELLKTQMAEKVDRDVARNEVYKNQVTNEYFEQFQTTHR